MDDIDVIHQASYRINSLVPEKMEKLIFKDNFWTYI